MATLFVNDSELYDLFLHDQPAPSLAYTLRPPWPQALLVTADPILGKDSPVVRVTQLNPVAWEPYTISVNIPVDDEKIARCLQVGVECVVGLPSRNLLRQLTICDLRLPFGISEGEISRFKWIKSQTVEIPSLENCPVNFECSIAHTEKYWNYIIAFLFIKGANINPELLFHNREEIISIYPTNWVDDILDENGALKRRVGVISELFSCPTFPVGPKRGWYHNFKGWMRELKDEKYLHPEELQCILSWYERWMQSFSDLSSADRPLLKANLTKVCNLIADERWEALHHFLSAGN